MDDVAAIAELPPLTVMQNMSAAVERYGSGPALRYKTGGGVWRDISWRDYEAEVRLAARGLIALGLSPGRGVSLIAFNRKEWLIGNFAAIYAGGVPAGIYTTNSAVQCKYVAAHSDSAIAVVENAEQLAKFFEIRAELEGLEAIVLMEGSHEDPIVHSWAELLERGAGVEEAELDQRIAAQQPEDLCTLIYTSGTTGEPKGVMLSHDNLSWTSRALATAMSVEPGGYVLSYLPLSHIAEQTLSIYLPMQTGGCTCFAESFDKLGDNLREIRPSIFLGVPRVWEKIQAKMISAAAGNSPIKKKISGWARKVGARATQARQQGDAPPLAAGLADRLVFSTVRERLGLDRSVLNVTSAAPIAKETLDFFSSLGVLVNEVYGMSECTGPATVSTPDKFRVGWVGWPLPGAQLKIAEDGEICMRGRHVFMGYFKNPEATAEALDKEGWLHSGDIGERAGDFYRITDRKKDIIITAGGENIAPQLIEGKLKNIVWVSQAVVIGDRRKHLSALLTLDEDKLESIRQESGSSAKSLEAMAEDAKVSGWLMGLVEQVNSDLAKVQRVKKIKILPRDLSIDGGELTPTMKVKRKIVNLNFAEEIEAFYS